jgi:hypothetical protein
MSERTSLSPADQQHQWIEEKLRTVVESINQIKQSSQTHVNLPQSPANQGKVAIKDLVIIQEHFDDIAADLEKVPMEERKRVTSLKLIQT